jgi:hypothetical protein
MSCSYDFIRISSLAGEGDGKWKLTVIAFGACSERSAVSPLIPIVNAVGCQYNGGHGVTRNCPVCDITRSL